MDLYQVRWIQCQSKNGENEPVEFKAEQSHHGQQEPRSFL